jgi:hypothetical protein
MVRVADVDERYVRAKQSGTRIISPPTDHPYGERHYTAEDLGDIDGRSRRRLPTLSRVHGEASKERARSRTDKGKRG